LCLEKKYAAEKQLMTFTTKNEHFSLNDNHSYKNTVPKWSMSKHLEMGTIYTILQFEHNKFISDEK